MISAGVKIDGNTAPTRTVTGWSGVLVTIKYKTGENKTNNSPINNDVMIDEKGELWRILTATAYNSTDPNDNSFYLSVENMDVDKQSNMSLFPDGSTNRGLVATPGSGGLQVPMTKDLVEDTVVRVAFSYNAESFGGGGSSTDVTFDDTTAQTGATTIQEALDYIFTQGVGGSSGTTLTNNVGTPYTTPLKAVSDNVNGAIVMRDNNGDFKATEIDATALRAKYADYAEKYTCKDNVSVGDVVSICPYDDYEVELCRNELSHTVVGIVSQNPGHLINSDCDGPAIARIGKVKAKIIGIVRNGDILVSAGDGCLRAIKSFEELPYKVGYSCEANILEDIKLVEIII
jgi:hypothetical protein